ncbi:hypothetical protein A9Y87_15080 [Salmonella enterica subsp. enterica]|nr:hypothetical protein A9Y87_15080 [Salmonella enterica subsp. enterica]
MEINEKLLRQIIEDVLRDMKGSDKPVSFNAPGPATGYRLQGERWEEIKNIPGALDPNRD